MTAFEDLNGRVAGVTGAASGIGFGIAMGLGSEGMNVVVADVEAPSLAAAEGLLRDAGVNVLALLTDVSDGASVEALARAAFKDLGK
jgi:NAD(P)-dependent dehydrogenase (short-subunit alcohol dehydrogenase family)